jgi:hypothetical protein
VLSLLLLLLLLLGSEALSRKAAELHRERQEAKAGTADADQPGGLACSLAEAQRASSKAIWPCFCCISC